MSKDDQEQSSRRKLLKMMAASPLAGTGLMGAGALSSSASAKAEVDPSSRRFLFVIGANGGASIVDSFLPILNTESNSGANTFTEQQIQQPNGSNFRCPIPLDNDIQGAIPLGDGYNLATFLSKHSSDMAVMTQEVSSVNHLIAARRSVTGDNINGGRTLQEAVAAKYGPDLLLPNCNMAGDGYGVNGEDQSLPSQALGEVISDARYFAFATHGSRGLKNAPDADLLNKARLLRQELEASRAGVSDLNRRELVSRYVNYRDSLMPNLEQADLINKLLLLQTAPDGSPLTDYDLEASPDGLALAERFPNLQSDPFEAQVALSYLLVKNGVTCSVSLAPSGTPFFDQDRRALTSPLGFDWSHVDHRGAQNAMWSRIMRMTDNLIDLLKASEFGDGQSLWDRSLIYIATEFGRDKTSDGGSGHDLNNGNVILSPFINGNRVFGGLDANTALTYGFDRQSGAPAPGTYMKEGDVYSAICQAMDIDFQGRRDVPAMMRMKSRSVASL